MQDKQLFEYAVIRVVPKVEREEFLNVGVVLYCRSSQFLQAKYTLIRERLQAFSPNIELSDIEARLQSFQLICIGGTQAGPIGLLPAASRFRWLTANKSTIVQTSPVHPGLCANPPGGELEKLFATLVEI